MAPAETLMVPVVWLGTLALLPAAGAPLVARTAYRRFAPATRAVLAGAAGAALVSFVMSLFTLAGIPWSILPIAAGAALLARALSALLPAAPAPPAPPASRRGRTEAVAAAAAGLCVLAALACTLAGSVSSMDLFFFWGPKAQQFAIARGVDAAFLADSSHAYMHAYYPPLVTNLGALATMAAGRFSWAGATLTFPLLLGALALALPGVLAGAAPRPAGAAVSALAIGALAVIGIRAVVAGNGDMPLLAFETLAMALLLRRDAGDPAIQLLAGILLAGAAAAKVEGLPFALAAAALFLLRRRGSARESAATAARLVLPAAAALGAWFAFGATSGLFAVYSEYGPFLALHLDHWPAVAREIPRALASTGRGLPWAVPLLCLAAAGRPRRDALLPLGTGAALAAFLVFTYLHLAEDPSQWISWSAARVLAPLPVLLALAIVSADASEPGGLA